MPLVGRQWRPRRIHNRVVVRDADVGDSFVGGNGVPCEDFHQSGGRRAN
jgi:hypothetical protein